MRKSGDYPFKAEINVKIKNRYCAIYLYYYRFVNIGKEGDYVENLTLVRWVLWHIGLCRLFNDKSIIIQMYSSISNNSVKYEYSVYCQKHFYLKIFNLVKQF